MFFHLGECEHHFQTEEEVESYNELVAWLKGKECEEKKERKDMVDFMFVLLRQELNDVDIMEKF